jgi:FlgD Ig-like domain
MAFPRLRATAIALLSIIPWLGTAAAQTGGTYNLKRNVIAAGGATFTSGGAFKLGGTSAQSNAAISSGGVYTLETGFWAGYVAGTVAVDPAPVVFPHEFRLMRAAPNPFASATVLSFQLPRESSVQLTIFDLEGHRVRTLVDQRLAPGTHRVSWDGRNTEQSPMPAGVYFAAFQADQFHDATRIVLLH